MDAIVVGIGTALADDPRLTARPAGPRTALRVVLDSMASLPTPSRLVQTARDVPVLVAVTEKAPVDRRRNLEFALKRSMIVSRKHLVDRAKDL